MKKLRTWPILTIAVMFLAATVSVNAQNQRWDRPLQKCWDFPSDILSSVPIASDNEKTFVLPFTDGSISAHDAVTGKKLWVRKAVTKLSSSLSINPGAIFFVGIERDAERGVVKNNFLSVDLSSGLMNWSTNASLPGPELHSVLNGGDRVYGISPSGWIVAVSKIDGRSLWKLNLAAKISAPVALSDRYLLVGTSNKTVVRISLSNGSIAGQTPVVGIPTAVQPLENGFVAGTKDGKIAVFRNGSEVWRIRTGGQVVAFQISGRDVIAYSNDNFVSRFSISKGSKRWKQRLAGRIIGYVALDQDFVAVATTGSSEAVIINVSTGEIVNRVEPKGVVYFTSPPAVVGGNLLLPTNEGLFAYSAACR